MKIFYYSQECISQNKTLEASLLIDNIEDSDLSSEIYFRKISLLTQQFLDGGYLDEEELKKYLNLLKEEEKIASDKFKKVLMVLILNAELPQEIINIISNFNFTESDKSAKGSLQNLFLAEKFSQNKDIFNSLNILFEIFSNKDFEDLSLLENYQVLKILKNFGFENYYKRLSIKVLQ